MLQQRNTLQAHISNLSDNSHNVYLYNMHRLGTIHMNKRHEPTLPLVGADFSLVISSHSTFSTH